ncbi:MAG: flagellar basal body-associated FliL family protein [Pirellulales bacterium]|jgi:flagellar FliL protein|nr:flagellar basal body-associated FliL family protein [Pirellulales bacterium]
MPASAPAKAPDNAAPPSRGGLLPKIIVLGFIAAVIGAECLFACMYLSLASAKAEAAAQAASPLPADAASAGGSLLAQPGEAASAGQETGSIQDAKSPQHPPALEKEVDLGEFSVTVLHTASNTTLLVDFHLFGTVRVEDEADFSQRYERSKQRIREQILMTVRGAELVDLADPGLGLIRRQILEKSNRLLGKPLLLGVIFSDFVLVEQ